MLQSKMKKNLTNSVGKIMKNNNRNDLILQIRKTSNRIHNKKVMDVAYECTKIGT